MIIVFIIIILIRELLWFKEDRDKVWTLLVGKWLFLE